MNINQINHQFQNEEFYIPNWEVKYLFVGTFNPSGGEHVKYYYGRQKNLFWKILSQIFKVDFNPNSTDFFDLIIKNKIACVDMINSINKINSDYFTENELQFLLGKGYSDSKIINNKFIRNYNTSEIVKIVNKNNCNVYSTWGKGSNLKEWKLELNKLSFTENLVSPSPVARVPKGVQKVQYILDDWSNKIQFN